MMDEFLTNLFEVTGLDAKTLTERALKLAEESGEVAEAVLSATDAPGSAYKSLSFADVQEEATDAAIVALAILAQTCVSEAEFRARFEELAVIKLRKWRDKLAVPGAFRPL